MTRRQIELAIADRLKLIASSLEAEDICFEADPRDFFKSAMFLLGSINSELCAILYQWDKK